MSDRRKTINAKPHHIEIAMGDGKFVLTFLCEKQKIKLHFERWWIPFITSALWKMVNREREAIANIERQMSNGKQP